MNRKLHRIKSVLVDANQTYKWLTELFGNDSITVAKSYNNAC